MSDERDVDLMADDNATCHGVTFMWQKTENGSDIISTTT
jgi:hypothetical protein